MIKTFCDRCGSDKGHVELVTIHKYETHERFDICVKCANSLRGWLVGKR